MWANESLKVYLYVPESASATTSPSFALAFVAASAANVCNTRNGGSFKSTVNNELYVFAPDKRYSAIPPNDAPCSDYNYTLTITPANASSQLSLSVLAAPWNGSCRVLLVDGSRCNDNDTYHAEVGEPMELAYELAPYCSKSDTFDGFTIRVDADAGGGQTQRLQSTTASASSGTPSASAFYSGRASDSSSSAIPEVSAGASTGNGSPSVSVVAGASAAAGATAIGLLTGLTVVVVVRRRRRQSRLPSKRANSAGVRGSQPPLHGDEAPSDYGQQQYSLYEGSPVCDRQSSAVARSSSEGRIQAPPLSRDRQFPTESEIHMVDNDLYGTAFGY